MQETLHQAFIGHGSTEMYTRIGTKWTPTAEDITYVKTDTNANIHTLDQGLALAKLAAKLGVPLNSEIMGAYTYMDMFEQQAPDFSEYPELLVMQKGKKLARVDVRRDATDFASLCQLRRHAIVRNRCNNRELEYWQ
ncbi:hypothetical protein [Enterococcus casseliflavus]|uniref:hypothetical protein n=1 Tax=Enterococcus casseliflavus TaxID=37734 RepID=UPI001432CEDD|nr:hypothetical protein [Enterococcus casseliflavus]NKD34146.1 hypothetical protein [Enterococcus casseliflavus]